jgi:hypothetical protein
MGGGDIVHSFWSARSPTDVQNLEAACRTKEPEATNLKRIALLFWLPTRDGLERAPSFPCAGCGLTS